MAADPEAEREASRPPAVVHTAAAGDASCGDHCADLAGAVREGDVATADREPRGLVFPPVDPEVLRAFQLPSALCRPRWPGAVDAGADRSADRIRGRWPSLPVGDSHSRAEK